MSRLRLDQAAIALSGLCMIHCVASVAGLFAIGLLSVVGGVDELFHQALLALIVPVSVLAMVAGYRRHRRASGAVNDNESRRSYLEVQRRSRRV